MDPSIAVTQRNKPQISADDMTSLVADAYHQIYADFADKPVPALDGATPRQMLLRQSGEARVRELLADFESNELRMAQEDGRDPVSLEFLYKKLGLAVVKPTVVTRGPGLYPDQFAVNEAWVVFRIGEPIASKDAGEVDTIGLMDAGSTCFLNFAVLPIGADFSEISARAFFEHLKVAAPPRPPRRLFMASDVASESLRSEAARRGIAVSTVEARSLDGIVGEARDSLADRIKTLKESGR